eukprot:g18198.t2
MWAPPLVDMESPSAPAVLAQACKDFGFFYVENHGVPEEVVAEVFRQSKAFFSLGIDDKMAVLAGKTNRAGYTPMHEQILDPANQTKGDTKEGYYVFRELAVDDEQASKSLKGTNQWPSEDLVPGWKTTMQEYFSRMHAVGERLVGLLSVGLGLDTSTFDGCFSQFEHVLRLLHYSAEMSDLGKGVIGAGAHSDWGMMTLLATDEVPGLQVRLDGEWLDVPPRKGAFICNLGDMLQRWTNDQLRSTVHRVVNKEGRERYSIPFFFDPNLDTEVACFPQFCSEENPAKYPPVTSGEYLACKDVGFFYVENHGVSEEVMAEVFRQSRAFFSLGIDDKMAVKVDNKHRGYTPMHEQILDPANQTKGDTKEGYSVFRELAADDEDDSTPLKGPNQWPSEDLVPGWKTTMQKHFSRMHAVGERLAGLLSVGLGLDASSFDNCFSEFKHVLRLLHYTTEVSDPGKGVMGAGAHSDWGMMTLLATDEVPGLQVRLDGEWLDVPPRKGAFICNLGDMLQRWTNDHLRSTVHRVLNKEGRERYSIAFFFEPNLDTEVACIPQFCSEENPAKYPPVTCGEYMLEKIKATTPVVPSKI